MAGLPEGFGLSFSYERVMVGRLIHNIREYPKIVGAIDDESRNIAIEMYQSIVKGGVHGTDCMTAEVSKTVENAYRDVQIAFANEVALLCESLGIDVYDVRKFVNGLPNDNSVPHANPVRNMHFPGSGVGGHCLPKDTWLLLHGWNEYGKGNVDYEPSILAGSRYLNEFMPKHTIELLDEALTERNKNLNGSRICVLGYAFLENSDDPRNTPTLPLVRELKARGAEVVVHDPYLTEEDGIKIEKDLESSMDGTDAVIIMTKHREYTTLAPEEMKRLMNGTVIIDGRNTLDGDKFIEMGFTFRGIGKGQYRGLRK
jgi:UDP-N-acetyl-D-mannosaminuronic acid dehydrogenase